MQRTKLPQSPNFGSGDPVLVKLAWNVTVSGVLCIPKDSQRLVMFAHGTGVCGPDNVHLARVLQHYGISTLLFNLLTDEEAEYDQKTGELHKDTVMLGDRLVSATIWLEEQRHLRSLQLGILGADAGAAAALVAAARLPGMIKAVALRSGNLEKTEAVWPFVKVPTLLLVSDNDPYANVNTRAHEAMICEKSMRTMERMPNILEESQALDFVGELAAAWFIRYLKIEALTEPVS